MPIYEFACPIHGLFDVFTRMGGTPDEATCMHEDCSERGERIFSAPARVNVRRTWNDKANDYRRDPYTQAKAQLTNMDREEQERGAKPMKITEEAIQVGARAIADKRPRKSVVQRAVEQHKKAKKNRA